MFSQKYRNEIRNAFENQMTLLAGRCEELQKQTLLMREKASETEAAGVTAPAYVTAFETEKCTDFDRLAAELLDRSKERLCLREQEIRETLAQCGEDEREAMEFLYSSMPVSDILDYSPQLFLTYARHGVFLWHEGPYAGMVPERMFANYVLHHRLNNEDMTETRAFFYEKLIDRVRGMNMREAILEVNYWCAAEGTYQTTDYRTENPMTMYRSAVGRCGEEAPFAVTALRSLGIPSRQVYSPLWSHCDSNHAWVEAWCDGAWHFFGGCEPENGLDTGWFAGPASRGMLIQSRFFSREEPEDEVVGKQGMAYFLNHLHTYADTAKLTVRVLDEQGHLVPKARVEFGILNGGKVSPASTIYTGSDKAKADYGLAGLTTGRGDFLISAGGYGCYGETRVSLAANSRVSCTVVIRPEWVFQEEWKDWDFHAPAEKLQEKELTEEERQGFARRLEASAKDRQEKTARLFDGAEAARILAAFSEEDRPALESILREARGNMKQVVRFLEWKAEGMEKISKRRVLETLPPKDYWDLDPQVLTDCCLAALPYQEWLPEDIFYPFVLCPRVAYEMMVPCREELLTFLGEEAGDWIRRNPSALPDLVDRMVISMPSQEYSNLITSPLGCLTGGIGSQRSREVLCIQIYRALGIPARLRPLDQTMEYYQDGRFIAVSRNQPAQEKAAAASRSLVKEGTLILRAKKPLELSEWNHYSLSRFEDGHFVPLILRREAEKATGEIRLALDPGLYRVITTNRLPDGSQYARNYDFVMEAGEKKEITMTVRGISTEAMLKKIPVKDFPLHTQDGQEKRLSELAGGGGLILWLEPVREPSQHILNEIYEKREQFKERKAPMYFVTRRGQDYVENATLKRTCEALPAIGRLTDDFGENYKTLAEETGHGAGQLPLAAVLKAETDSVFCIYSDAGYKVGLADILLQILQE